MKNADFVGYVGLPDFHDGVVLRVSLEGKTAEVVVEGYSGREHVVLFEGVQAVEMNRPEGMLLYSLSEMRAAPAEICVRQQRGRAPRLFIHSCN